MELPTTKIAEMLSEAFDHGYHGTESQEEVIALLLEKFQIAEDVEEKEEEFRIYKAAELAEMPVGTVFTHQQIGLCKIQQKDTGEKYMVFDNIAFAPSEFNVDSYPWNLPMKRS